MDGSTARTRSAGDMAAICSQLAGSFIDLPVQRIEQVVQPTAQQRSRDVSLEARVVFLRSSKVPGANVSDHDIEDRFPPPWSVYQAARKMKRPASDAGAWRPVDDVLSSG
jgi:hypothetical protein